jgi:hypothetical protein
MSQTFADSGVPETMSCCPECGCERLGLGRPYPYQMPHAQTVLRVPSVQCDDCGRTYPMPGGIDAVVAPFIAATLPPPAAYPSSFAQE